MQKGISIPIDVRKLRTNAFTVNGKLPVPKNIPKKLKKAIQKTNIEMLAAQQALIDAELASAQF